MLKKILSLLKKMFEDPRDDAYYINEISHLAYYLYLKENKVIYKSKLKVKTHLIKKGKYVFTKGVELLDYSIFVGSIPTITNDVLNYIYEDMRNYVTTNYNFQEYEDYRNESISLEDIVVKGRLFY